MRTSTAWWIRGAVLAGGCVLGTAHAAATWVPPPAPSSPVTDLAGVLSPATRTSLASRLTAYEARSGHQVIVYIDRTTAGVPIETFAVDSFAAWKPGRSDRDDGLAVFAMTEDRAVRIEVGYGLEASVTDLAASAVIRTTMVPLIQAGEWDEAAVRGVESLVDTIEGQPGSLDAAGPEPAESDDLSPAARITALVLGVMFLIFFIVRPRSALGLLFVLGRAGLRGASGGGFRGGGGRSGGGGASGRW